MTTDRRRLTNYVDRTPDGLVVAERTVIADWVDHNGHMNVASYLKVFDNALCAFSDHIGIGPSQMPRTGLTIFVGQANIVYRRELRLGDFLDIALRVLALGPERAHVCMTMRNEAGETAAFNEQLLVCASLETRRPAHLPGDVAEILEALRRQQADQPPPRYLGRVISLEPAPA